MPDNIDPVLKSTINVSVDEWTFIFRIPSFADEIKLGLRSKQIRRELELELLGPNPTPEQQMAFTGGESTYDGTTEGYVRTAAQFSILLKQSSAEWIYSKDEKGNPVCDYKKWPDDKINVVMAAGADFSLQLSRFRSGRLTPPKQPPVDEIVDSQQNPAHQPVQPGDVEPHGTAT